MLFDISHRKIKHLKYILHLNVAMPSPFRYNATLVSPLHKAQPPCRNSLRYSHPQNNACLTAIEESTADKSAVNGSLVKIPSSLDQRQANFFASHSAVKPGLELLEGSVRSTGPTSVRKHIGQGVNRWRERHGLSSRQFATLKR